MNLGIEEHNWRETKIEDEIKKNNRHRSLLRWKTDAV
jgi:hypothetical protein